MGSAQGWVYKDLRRKSDRLLVDVYLGRARQTGLSGVDRKGLRGELLYRMAACLNHYVEADPDAGF